ncbi:MAG: hypothetical protein ACK4KV_17225 [Rhodocyclaceae bacterium]
MATKTNPDILRNGLASLLRPDDSVLVLIDHQPDQLANPEGRFGRMPA